MATVEITVTIGEHSTRIVMTETDDEGRPAGGKGASKGDAYMPTERNCDSAVGAIVAGMWERARRRLGQLKVGREADEAGRALRGQAAAPPAVEPPCTGCGTPSGQECGVVCPKREPDQPQAVAGERDDIAQWIVGPARVEWQDQTGGGDVSSYERFLAKRIAAWPSAPTDADHVSICDAPAAEVKP